MSNVSSSNGQGVIAPKLRFNGFLEDWELVRIGDVYAERSERGAENMDLLSVTMTEGVKMRSDIEGKDNSSEDKSNYKIVYTGDMVYNSMRMWQGASGISPYDGIVSPAYTILKPRIPISNGFFAALFKNERLINAFRKNSQGMTSDTWNLKYPQIETIKIHIPSVSEQEKISEFIALVDAKIAKQRILVDSLKKYKRGLVSSILSEKIKISDEPWEECTIGDFLASKSIKQLPTEEAPLMAFTATGGVCDKGERYDRGFLVKDASTKLYKRTDYGDFIYSSNNLDVGSIGLNLYGSAVISDVYEIFSINGADPWFISEVIQQKPIMRDILKYRQGCLYGQYRIYAEDFLSVKIRIPSLPLQSKIGALISQVESKILAEQGLLDNLEKCKAALLQMMFI
ncbi:MAG: restriction endonuclease subunit S [Ruminococcaceae bacterium]|nr:restriction endonuclease subunit S [Oscillospiraceae bacterium]